MNMKAWASSVKADSRRRAVPIMTHPGIEIIGRKAIDAVTDGKVHFQAIKALAERYPAAASTVIMDLTVEAEAFGATICFSDDEVPSVTGTLVGTADEIEKLEIPPLTAGRIPQFIEANRLAAANMQDIPVFAGCIGPFSLAGRLFDMTGIMMAMYIEPETIQQLLGKCTDFILEYGKAIKNTGVNGIIIAEPAAGLLSDEDCRHFSSIHVKRIVEALQDDDFMVILHNCGNRGHCTGAMLHTGAAGYHFGNAMDMTAALKECPEDVLVMGNLDPVFVFKQASASEVYDATSELLKRAGTHPNFILSSGCDTPPGVPFANIDAFYRALDDYNASR